MDSKSELLLSFGTPPRAIHHPKEVCFHPTHSVEAELSAKPLMSNGISRDVSTKGLINHHRLVIELSENVLPILWPSRLLLLELCCFELHTTTVIKCAANTPARIEGFLHRHLASPELLFRRHHVLARLR